MAKPYLKFFTCILITQGWSQEITSQNYEAQERLNMTFYEELISTTYNENLGVQGYEIVDFYDFNVTVSENSWDWSLDILYKYRRMPCNTAPRRLNSNKLHCKYLGQLYTRRYTRTIEDGLHRLNWDARFRLRTSDTDTLLIYLTPVMLSWTWRRSVTCIKTQTITVVSVTSRVLFGQFYLSQSS